MALLEGLFSSDKLDSLQDLYVEELRDLYSAENQIVAALPQMIKAATRPELKQGFQLHLNRHVSKCNVWSRFSKSWARVLKAKPAEECRAF